MRDEVVGANGGENFSRDKEDLSIDLLVRQNDGESFSKVGELFPKAGEKFSPFLENRMEGSDENIMLWRFLRRVVAVDFSRAFQRTVDECQYFASRRRRLNSIVADAREAI